jgi:hypothetical protein
VLVEHDDRLEAVLVVMAIEQAQLLLAVNGIEGLSPSALAKAPSISSTIRFGTCRNPAQ